MIADVILKVAGMEQDFWSQEYRPRPSAAGQCIRALVYRRMGVTPQPSPDRLAIVFDDGHWHEELTAAWIAKTSFTLHSQQAEVTCGLVCGRPLKGHIDGILGDVAGVDRLLEHKALNHFTWQRYAAIIEDGGSIEKADSYYIQTQLYLCSEEISGMGITEAILLIKNKNTGQYLEFILTPHPAIAAAALAKLNDVETFAATEEVPPRPFNRATDWQCDYCPFSERCWQGYKEDRKELREYDPELDAAVTELNEASAAKSAAELAHKDAKARIVHRLDELGASKVTFPDGTYVSWTSSYRKSYTVEASEVWRLDARRPKVKGGGK